MAGIRVLDPHVADMIAAGEVVERPASVVKELAENAIDAGAGKITVELKNGGISFLRITDDGCGIAAEDLPTAFLRHATSKIATADDLTAIGTLGFRGEALASIAAVAKVEVLTKRREDAFGSFLKLSAGKGEDHHEAGCPDGTTFTVRELFFNQPARMKFLKKDAAEAGAVQDTVVHLALGNPAISFRLIVDGKEKLHTPGDGNLKNCIYRIYGKEYAAESVPIRYSADGITVSGFCGSPAIARSTRSYQTFFVNDRLIKSRAMAATVEQAYQDGLMKGKFPFCVLFTELDRSLTDVNVHPAKSEVKFSNEKAVMSAIYWAVKNALYGASYQPRIETEPSLPKPNPAPEPRPKTAAAPKSQEPTRPTSGQVEDPLPVQTQIPQKTKQTGSERKLQTPSFSPRFEEPPVRQTKSPEPKPQSKKTELRQYVPPLEEEKETAPSEFPVRLVGQVFRSYLIAERGEELLLIDQHAAHERLLFEQLVKEYETSGIVSQTLLTPLVLDMTASDFAAVTEQSEALSSMGFELEEFGDHSMRLTAAPQFGGREDITTLFWETFRALCSHGKRGSAESEALYSMACHAAVKANRELHPEEMEKMVREALALPPTCPHGRPIVVTMTKKMLEKQFKRIV